MVSEEWQDNYLKVITSTDNTLLKINNLISNVITINIWVLEGSVLGPLLFNICIEINGTHKCTTSLIK